MSTLLTAARLSKTFTLFNQGGASSRVFENVELTLRRGECIVLDGPSGCGKSTLLRMLYGNYLCDRGSINIDHEGEWINLCTASANIVLDVRRCTIGYVSQFMRVIPRVTTLDLVAEPLRMINVGVEEAYARARSMLTLLRMPDSLWPLSPLTFSGGEQQRVNLARCFVADYPIILLDEPTSSLDRENHDIVVDLIKTSRRRGAGIVAAFHGPVAQSIGTSSLDVSKFKS